MIKRKAFSLVELLAVVLLIALMAVFAVPKYMQSIRDTKTVQCFSSRVNAQKADERYYHDHNSRPAEDFAALVKEGYLDRQPKCFQGGVYVFSGAAPFRFIVCSIHGFSQLYGDPASSNILYKNSFSGAGLFKAVRGSWRIVSGALVPEDTASAQAVFGDAAWKDYSIIAKAALSGGSGYGILYRIDGAAALNGYVMYYRAGAENKFTVSRIVKGVEGPTLASAPMQAGFAVYGAPHMISISVKGAAHSVFVDGREVLNFTDQYFPMGMAGFSSGLGSACALDEITITKL